MNKYRKLIVAVLGAVLVALSTFFDLELPFDAEGITTVIVSMLTAIGVWAVPNDPTPG